MWVVQHPQHLISGTDYERRVQQTAALLCRALCRIRNINAPISGDAVVRVSSIHVMSRSREDKPGSDESMKQSTHVVI